MHIRIASPKDGPYLVDVAYEAFRTDVFHNFLHPRMEKYPWDLKNAIKLRMKRRFLQPDTLAILVVSDEDDGDFDGTEKFLGYAMWHRKGTDAGAKKWQHDNALKKFDRWLVSWEQWYQDKFMDYATDYDHINAFTVLVEKVVEGYYKTLDSYWHISSLAVHPKAQRRGIGAMLLEYGLEMAHRDGVPVTLESSPAGRGLYTKYGFQIIVEKVVFDDIDPVCIMKWDPATFKSRLESADDGTAKWKSSSEDKTKNRIH